jgi:hypothetical protein
MAMLHPAETAPGYVDVSRGGMADQDSQLVRKFLDLLKKLKDASPEARDSGTPVQEMKEFLKVATDVSIGVNFASCFLKSLKALSTASSKLVGPTLDLAEFMVSKKMIHGKSLSQLSNAIYEVATSTSWGETVDLEYIPTCISLMKGSVHNWKSQDPDMEERVAAILRCFWHWSDKTQLGEHIVLSDSCADVIHKSISWLNANSKNGSAEDPIQCTTELLGGAVCALKVPKDEIIINAAILISYAVMSDCTVTMFSQSKAPEVLLNKLLDAVKFKSGSAAGKGLCLSVIRAVVNAVYLACMKGFRFQREMLMEVVTALHTCIVRVELQDPWLWAMSASLLNVWRIDLLYTGADQSFLETAGQDAIQEFQKLASSKLALLQFVGLRLFTVEVHHWHAQTGIGLHKPTDADALKFRATLTDIVKRISVCIQRLSAFVANTPMQLPDIPPHFIGTGWSRAESVSVSEMDDVTTLGPAWHFLWKRRTRVPLIDDNSPGFRDKVYALCMVAVEYVLHEFVPSEHLGYASFKAYEESFAGSLSKIITTYGDVIYGNRDMEGRHDRSESPQLNVKVLSLGLAHWNKLLRQHQHKLPGIKDHRPLIPIDQHGSLKEAGEITSAHEEFPFKFVGLGVSAGFLYENANNVIKVAQGILEVSVPLDTEASSVPEILHALQVIDLLSVTSMGPFLAYMPCAKSIAEWEFIRAGDISHLSTPAASCVKRIYFDDPKKLWFVLDIKATILMTFHQIRHCQGRTEKGECQAYVKAAIEYLCDTFSTILSSEGIDPIKASQSQHFITEFMELSDTKAIFLVNSPKLAPRGPVVPLPSLDNPSNESTDHGSDDRGLQDLAGPDKASDHPLSDPPLRTSSDMGRRLDLPETLTTTLQRSELVEQIEAYLEIESILEDDRATTSDRTYLDEARPKLLKAVRKVRLSYAYCSPTYRPCNTH